MRRANLFFGSVILLAWLQFRESGLPGLSAELEISTGVPSRVYLFKDDRPFRLSPVDALLPLKVDSFYRERLWRRVTSPRDARGQSSRNGLRVQRSRRAS